MWKKVQSNLIVKLQLFKTSKRLNATTQKCRTDKAKVLAIENIDGSKSELTEVYSCYDKKFIYKIGKTLKITNFDNNRWNECSAGIHYFNNRQLAVEYFY